MAADELPLWAKSPDGSRPRRPAQARTIAAPSELEEEESVVTGAITSTGTSLGVFHNTYYCFPNASDYEGQSTTIYDGTCKPIATVPKAFHDTLCVQGSGRLSNGQTASFAKRDCSCADECPRSGQKICYEALDPQRFPWGRGATGGPITPFRTVAVDSAVIPLGTRLFIAAYVGLRLPDGRLHDGCFRAEDRGLKVVGHRIDVYTGSESETHEWNQQVPTAMGLEVFSGDARCSGR